MHYQIPGVKTHYLILRYMYQYRHRWDGGRTDLGDQGFVELRKKLVRVVEVGLQDGAGAGVQRVVHGGEIEERPARGLVKPEAGVADDPPVGMERDTSRVSHFEGVACAGMSVWRLAALYMGRFS